MEKDVTRNIEEQLSAFLDGELPDEELQLLVRRLARDEEHRATLARYALIGDVLRKDPVLAPADGFRAGIMAAIENVDEPATATVQVEQPTRGWVKPLASAAVVALAVIGLGNSSLFQSPTTQGAAGVQTAQLSAQNDSGAGPALVQSQPAQQSLQQPSAVKRPPMIRRAVVNRDRMTSYMVSHGDYARTFQGPMGDSRIFIQQARFEQ